MSAAARADASVGATLYSCALRGAARQRPSAGLSSGLPVWHHGRGGKHGDGQTRSSARNAASTTWSPTPSMTSAAALVAPALEVAGGAPHPPPKSLRRRALCCRRAKTGGHEWSDASETAPAKPPASPSARPRHSCLSVAEALPCPPKPSGGKTASHTSSGAKWRDRKSVV